MPDVCPKCGLNKELCVCEVIAKEEQRISIRKVKRRFGKITTIIEGISKGDIDIKNVTKQLKSKLACGGTIKNNIIELQGDHVQRVKDELIALGFNPNTINTD